LRILIGLGGNLGDVAGAFGAAAEALAARFAVVARSSLWRSAAVGPPQPEFLNAALLVEAEEEPFSVLALLQTLEAGAGRDRRGESRFGPRTLDLDLLLAPWLVVESPALTLPHPRLAERRFALLPAAELAPGWTHPRRRLTLTELAAALDPREQPCERIGPFP